MKSPEILLNEALAALETVGKKQKFLEKRKAGTPIEVQLNLAETILKESKVIRYHNGAADNGHGELLTESGGSYVSEVTDPRELQVKGYMLSCNINEAEARKVLGLAPKELNRAQAAEYMFAVRCGISESDAMKLVTLPKRF